MSSPTVEQPSVESRLSPRLQALRDEIMDRKGSFVDDCPPMAMDVAAWRAQRPGQSWVQYRAAMLKELVELSPIRIRPGWRLAGEHLARNAATPVARPRNPEERAQALIALGVDPARAADVEEAVARWNGRAFGNIARGVGRASIGCVTSDLEAGAGGKGADDTRTVYWGRGWSENHSVRDYAKLARIGFAGLRREIEERLETADLSHPDHPCRLNFWLAALDVCDAGIRLGERYAGAARRLADRTDDAEDHRRLEAMAEACARVPAEGARSFFEATQAVWFGHVLTCGEDGINANSIGRLDRILYPWYRADIDAGRLTPGEAREIMEELACKLYLEYDVQAIVLGGVDAAGRDAVNELSHLILEATRNVGFIRDVSVRLGAGSPPDFVRRCAELIAEGGGIPFVFNDDCFLQALTDRGIPLADARDYAPIGCIELTIPGKTLPHAVSGWFNGAKCLELALFDGVDPASGERVGPATGRLADHACFDDFVNAYHAQVDFFARRMAFHCNRGELAQRDAGPLPCWSVLTDDCIARGRDITDGGPLYNYHSICLMGVPNTADALMALKRLVYEEGRLDPAELLDALRADFEGHESVRQMLRTQAPKYGNDEPEVDELAAMVAGRFIDLMDRLRTSMGARFFVHLFTFKLNITFGRMVGATPDGRRAGEPLAYSLSAHQGRDERGVTALLNSLARLPHHRAAGASAAIVDLDPGMVAGPDGIERLARLIEAAIAMKVGQLQWNVVTAERLRQAQQDPERYGNIPVRVAGYSQMFRLIDRDLQEHIIARTKHTS